MSPISDVKRIIYPSRLHPLSSEPRRGRTEPGAQLPIEGNAESAHYSLLGAYTTPNYAIEMYRAPLISQLHYREVTR